MDDLIKAFDDLPKGLKIVLCLPFLDIVWSVYKLFKSIKSGNNIYLVLSIILLIVGVPWIWLIDLVTVIVNEKVWWFC